MAEAVGDLTPELAAWVRDISGATPLSARRLAGGGSRHTILIDGALADGSRLPLVLRLEGGGSHSGTSFSLEREFLVYRALAGTAVPAPRAYGLLEHGAALLLERLEGTAAFREMPEDQQPHIARNFMVALGELHALDVRALDLPGFERPRTPAEHATIDLDRWRALARESCWDEPLIRYSFARLRACAPLRVQRTVLVQGDTGPGNFMATSERVTGLIDWEFCHIGDPMDDFGWLAYRAGDALSLFEAAYPVYEAASGLKVDLEAARYYYGFAMLRCAVTVALGKSRGGALGIIPYRFAFQNYLSRIAEFLVGDARLPLSREVAPAFAAPANPLFSEARGELRNFVLNGFESGRGRTAVQAAMTALTHLELREKFGRQLDEEDEEERACAFGDVEISALAEAADKAGEAGDATMLAYLARRAWRQRSLWPR